MKKLMKYYVVQKLEYGEWKNCSCRYFISGLKGALGCLNGLIRREDKDGKYRIARGMAYFEL